MAHINNVVINLIEIKYSWFGVECVSFLGGTTTVSRRQNLNTLCETNKRKRTDNASHHQAHRISDPFIYLRPYNARYMRHIRRHHPTLECNFAKLFTFLNKTLIALPVVPSVYHTREYEVHIDFKYMCSYVCGVCVPPAHIKTYMFTYIRAINVFHFMRASTEYIYFKMNILAFVYV